MKLALRALWLVALVGLWFVVPSQVDPAARAALGQQLVGDWLTGAESPLPSLVRDGKLPELDVDLRTSPPIVDPDQRRSRAQEYSVPVGLWADEAGVGRDPQGAAAWPFSVRIGELGVQAELPLPDGSQARFVRAFPTRLGLLPVLVAVALAPIGVPTVLWLLLCFLSSLVMLEAAVLPGEVSSLPQGLLRQLATLPVACLALLATTLDLLTRQSAKLGRMPWVVGVGMGLAFVLAGMVALDVERFLQHTITASWPSMVVLVAAAVVALVSLWATRSHAFVVIALAPWIDWRILAAMIVAAAALVGMFGKRSPPMR